MKQQMDIVYWPDPILRTSCTPVKLLSEPPTHSNNNNDTYIYAAEKANWNVFEDGINDLIDNMFNVMRRYKGIGLAANQIGVDKRVIIVSSHGDNELIGPMVLINPEIVSASDDKKEYEEGCLSFPGQTVKISRPSEIVVDYVSICGHRKKLRATKLLAICIQHEIDHISGKVIIDHTDYLIKNRIENQLKKFLRRTQ